MVKRRIKVTGPGACLIVLGLLISVVPSGDASAPAGTVPTVNTAELRTEVDDFLGKELGAHLADIKTFDPPPQRVVGTPTSGDFSWGTFMYALARYANATGQRELAGRSLAESVGKLGLIDARSGAKTFS